jgi:glycosyltransferase involved in cell wall biosynthesis
MKVVANLLWITPGRVGGSEEYSTRLLNAVIDQDVADIDLRIIGSAALLSAHPELGRVPFDVVGGPTHVRPYRVVAESTAVARKTRDADVVHHFGGRVPARHHGHDVVTIHDIQPLQMPENFSGVKRRYLKWALPRSARSARLITTPSEWVASTVVETFDVPASDVRAVSSTYDPGTETDDEIVAKTPAGPLILYPAVTHPHKDHDTLIDGFVELRRTMGEASLVLTGGAGVADARVRSRVEAAAGVHHLGRVPAASLRALYQRADVVAFPSRYEGFGLPILEALRAQTPVVIADTPALREVAGDAARVVPSTAAADWAAALEAGFADTVGVAAAARVAHYAPSAAALRLIDAWRSVANADS